MSEDQSCASNNLYFSIFNSIKDCVVLYKVVNNGENFEFSDLNHAAEVSEAVKKEDLLGKFVTEVFPAVKDFGLFKVFQEVYNDGVTRYFPITFYEDERINGWRENHIYKLNDDYIFAVYSDLTKEKQVEEKLKLLAKVFETSLEGVLITDKDSIILKANKAFCQMSEFSEDEIIGKKVNILKSDIYKKEFYIKMLDSIDRKDSWQGEIWDRKKSGTSFAVLLNISVVYDEKHNVKNYIGAYLDITEKKKAQENIYKLEYFDTLTGLANRSQFEIKIQDSINMSKRRKEQFSLLFLDLDNFKYINDTYGHNIGDLLLIEVAKKIQAVLREVDFFTRLGGDEFAIISRNIKSNDEIAVLSSRILETFNQPFIIQGNTFHVGCSIGISIYPIDSEDKHTLIKNADTAMYQSKKDGKQRFNFHTADMNRNYSHKLELNTNLREAIIKSQFEMYFQPKISTQTSNIYGAEALIRWNSPTLGFVSPDEFIPYAEESGLIIPIGDFVLEEVFNKSKEIEDKGYNINISINISSVQLDEENFIEKVKLLLKSTKCNPNMLEFEITESSIMNNVEENIKKLLLIRELGIKISIDDFGTAYSSMNYLQKLPIDILKIDKSFIDNVEDTNGGKLIVKGIISLAKALSLETVAEGVETKKQKDVLKEMECDMIQGFFFSKPLNSSDFLNFLQKRKN